MFVMLLARSLQSHDGKPRHHMTMNMTMTFTPPTSQTFEIKRKFVRIKEVRQSGLVCFEFAIGWPELFVDLMLPQPAFDEFCVQNQVQVLND